MAYKVKGSAIVRRKEGQQLETIRAIMLYRPRPWPDAVYTEAVQDEAGATWASLSSDEARRWKDKRCIFPPGEELLREWAEDRIALTRGHPAGTITHIHYENRPEPWGALPPTLWLDVVQWALAFERGDWSRIRGFYRQYGSLGGLKRRYSALPPSAWAADVLADPWGWAKGVLGWFQTLTVIVDALKNDQHERLREYYPGPYDPGWWPFVHLEDLNYGFSLHELKMARMSEPEVIDRRNPTEKELRSVMWQQVAGTVALELRKIPLEPLDYEDGNLVFAFAPRGAFHAAFLQWYFREFADVRMRVCEAEGCDQLLPPDRPRFCSPRCEQRESTRRYRGSRRLIDELDREGRTPRQIAVAIDQQIGVSTTAESVEKRLPRIRAQRKKQGVNRGEA